MFAGFPCIHLSPARAYRQNLSGTGSNLFCTLLQLLNWIQQIFEPYCRVKFCVENVASMDDQARKQISYELGVRPIKLDPADSLPFNRPRLAWTSEVVEAMDGLELWAEKEYVRAYVLEGSVSKSQWVTPGWKRADPTAKLPTFMKSIKRNQPPPVPAGIKRTSEETQRRWRLDHFRFPPYQYSPEYLFVKEGEDSRIANASERELLGYGYQHTATCRSASDIKRDKREFEEMRKTLCGDSFAVSSFAIIASVLCQAFIPRMRPGQIIQRLGIAPGHSARPSLALPVRRGLSYSGKTGPPASRLQLVKQLGLTVNRAGSDVRLVTSEAMGRKLATHASVRAWWWQWKHLFAVKWKRPSHTILWKCRRPENVNKRWLRLEDSMVSLLILCKGRTSSRLLQPLCQQLGAAQLAIGSTLLHAWTRRINGKPR